jgi:hypothetical protein
MSTLSILARRSRVLRASNLRYYTGPTVDYDHFTSGWNIDDIKDFTKPGKYVTQTFNKISPQVRAVLCRAVLCLEITKRYDFLFGRVLPVCFDDIDRRWIPSMVRWIRFTLGVTECLQYLILSFGQY